MRQRTAADVFVECLEAEGVGQAFGIPGEETLDFNESLDRSSIRFVPADDDTCSLDDRLEVRHHKAMDLRRLDDARWEIPQTDGMLVPGIVFASEELIVNAAEDRAIEQVANVAHLPGIVVASYAMPDIHWGYGFPIGGVAATDIDAGGVVSPGGVGFDICCGVRLLATELSEE